VVTHRMRLEEARTATELFNDKHDECVKVVLTP
jgi:threonine dehydrogenase-like Zn-dependent dehydrogenase